MAAILHGAQCGKALEIWDIVGVKEHWSAFIGQMRSFLTDKWLISSVLYCILSIARKAVQIVANLKQPRAGKDFVFLNLIFLQPRWVRNARINNVHHELAGCFHYILYSLIFWWLVFIHSRSQRSGIVLIYCWFRISYLFHNYRCTSALFNA